MCTVVSSHRGNHVVGRQDRVREEPVVDQCCPIAITPLGVTGARDRILDHDHLKALLEELAQVALDAHVRQHPAQDDLRHRPFPELQDQVVRLRAEYFVRADDDRLAVLNVWLEAIQPIRAGVFEPREAQRVAPGECMGPEFIRLERTIEFPCVG